MARWVGSGLIAFLACGCMEAGPQSDPGVDSEEFGVRHCADGPTIKGIDVSSWQGTIDWNAVQRSGIKFAIVRVTDGSHHLDKRFAQNWLGARQAGLLRGAYQFFRPAQDATAQADLLIEQIAAAG